MGDSILLDCQDSMSVQWIEQTCDGIVYVTQLIDYYITCQHHFNGFHESTSPRGCEENRAALFHIFLLCHKCFTANPPFVKLLCADVDSFSVLLWHDSIFHGQRLWYCWTWFQEYVGVCPGRHRSE